MATLHAWTATTRYERLIGAISQDQIAPQTAVAFECCRWIHTFFMVHGIDCVLLDRDRRVIGMAERLPPQRILKFGCRVPMLLELRAGEISRLSISRGDVIELNPLDDRDSAFGR
jgi:uncharacterized membrane protein (UPF0127 family)